MKVLEETKQLILTTLPQCKSREEVMKLFNHAQNKLQESEAAYGQKQHMWQEIKANVHTLSRRAEIVSHAHNILADIIKRQV